MSHEIEYNKVKGTYSFYSRKEVAWHKLGQVVQEAQTSTEVIKLANLDFEVIKVPNYAKNQDEYILNPDSFSTLRTDTKFVLGTVGSKYKILQNTEAFNFFDNIVASKEAIFETAGVLRNGQKVFITAKLPDYIRLSNNDVINKYLLLSNDHSGKEAVKVTFTGIRVVCNNTLSMAMDNSNQVFKIYHTEKLKEKMKIVTNLLQSKKLYFEELEESFSKMQSIKMNEKNIKHEILKLFLTSQELEIVKEDGLKVFTNPDISKQRKNLILDVMDWTESGVGQDLYKGTGMWLYNGINGYFNNAHTYKSDLSRFESLIDGAASKIINRAMSNILQLSTS